MRNLFISLVLMLMTAGLLAGCTSVVQRENGTWDVPKQVEHRSLFGTNQSALYISNCKTEVRKWFIENEYTNCSQASDYQYAYSQGQGGQIVSGAFMGLGLGLGLAHSGSTVNQGTNLNQHVDNGGVIYNKK